MPVSPRVFYSLRDIADNLQMVEQVDLTVRWESTFEKDTRGQEINEGVEELNELFRRKVEALLDERNAVCARVKHERVTQSRNYAHGSLVIVGEYLVEIFKYSGGESF